MECNMLKKLKALLFKPTQPEISVRIEHVEGDTSGFIVIWSDDKQTQLATFPDIIKPEKLEQFLKENKYQPIEYFVNT